MSDSIISAAIVERKPTSSGPTQYKPVVVSGSPLGVLTDGPWKYQLVARVSDSETFVVVCKADATTEPLLDAINARNVARHTLTTERDALPDESKRNAAQKARAAEIADAIKALPKLDADRAGRVARALAKYSDAE